MQSKIILTTFNVHIISPFQLRTGKRTKETILYNYLILDICCPQRALADWKPIMTFSHVLYGLTSLTIWKTALSLTLQILHNFMVLFVMNMENKLFLPSLQQPFIYMKVISLFTSSLIRLTNLHSFFLYQSYFTSLWCFWLHLLGLSLVGPHLLWSAYLNWTC